MITFRYHVVSLVAVLLALAVGIVLGSGPLEREDSAASSGDSDARALAAAEARVAELEEGQTFADAYATATAGELVGTGLEGRAVTLVTLPGADDDSVAAATDMVAQAGGSVTARVVFEEKLLDVANRQLVTELATQMHDSVRQDVEVPAGASGYERLGLLVAHAIASTKDRGEPVDGAGDSVLAGVATADLVTTQGNVGSRGSLVMVVAGEPYGDADLRSGAGSIAASLLMALDAGSDGVVLTGPVAAGADDGLVGSLRSDPTAAKEISTVDVTDQVAGIVAAVLALEEQAGGGTGHYGSTAADDGAVPGASAQ